MEDCDERLLWLCVVYASELRLIVSLTRRNGVTQPAAFHLTPRLDDHFTVRTSELHFGLITFVRLIGSGEH